LKFVGFFRVFFLLENCQELRFSTAAVVVAIGYIAADRKIFLILSREKRTIDA
jgi:hypothetical protein